MSDTLLVAGFNKEPEIFYTVEGEGRFAGYPSVFLRLAMCNLTCKGFASKDSPHGCDSYVSWSVKNKLTFEEIFTIFEKNVFIEKLRDGALLKITGGEPLIQQNALLDFVKQFVIRYGFLPQIDFETNGTIMPVDEWVDTFNATFTTSPKLANNGDDEDKRFKELVLRRLVEYQACFKFVIKTDADLREVHDKYVNNPKIKLPKSLIYLMPCCGSRQEQGAVAQTVAELCKNYGVKFSARLHLLIWDRALRV